MDTPRISASSYSNTAPLIWSFLYGSQHGRVELILDNAPARSAELLSQGRVDAALVPVIAYHELAEARLYPDVCVGASKRARSVCLVTRNKELSEVRSVGLDVSSRTSIVLTKIIFREFLGFEPAWRCSEPDVEMMLEQNDAALVIGDPALLLHTECRTRNAELRLPKSDLRAEVAGNHNDSAFRVRHSASQENSRSEITKYDLAELWNRYTGTGFVFAMWMSRHAHLAIDFAGARDEGLTHLNEIVSNYESQIGLGPDELRRYLSDNISYSIDEGMERGLELYFELAGKCGLVERVRPITFLE